jgi:hypothetical protein
MNYLYLLASGASAFALVVQLMLGRPRPPPASDLAERSLAADAWFGRFAMIACLALMTIAYSAASRRPDAADAVLLMSTFAAALAGLKLVLGALRRLPRLDLLDWGPTALASALGFLGVAWAALTN